MPADPAILPSALRDAARPSAGCGTLVLDAGGQNVVVIIGAEGGDPGMIWAFIRRQLAGGKPVRM